MNTLRRLWCKFSNVDVNISSLADRMIVNIIFIYLKSPTELSIQRHNIANDKLYFRQKANGESYEREWLIYSQFTGWLVWFVCKVFAIEKTSVFVKSTGSNDIKLIESHEKSFNHKDSLLIYLTLRQGLGLQQNLEKQIQ